MIEVENDMVGVDSRMMTSSPAKVSIDSDCSRLENELTPVKDLSLSLRIDANESLEAKKIMVTNGLLAISTPEQHHSRMLFTNPAFNFYKNLMHLNSTPKSVQKSARKPRVNFHSIDDIVNGGKSSDDESSEHCDSGYQSHSVLSNLSNCISINAPKETLLTKPKHHDVDVENNSENEAEYDDKHKSNTNSNNNKKIRTTFSDQQKWMLEQYFRRNPYPDPKETEDLSKQLSLPENVIKVWFQNKRSRDKQRKFTKTAQSNTNSNTDYATQINNLQLFTNALAPYVAAASNQIISGFY